MANGRKLPNGSKVAKEAFDESWKEASRGERGPEERALVTGTPLRPDYSGKAAYLPERKDVPPKVRDRTESAIEKSPLPGRGNGRNGNLPRGQYSK